MGEFSAMDLSRLHAKSIFAVSFLPWTAAHGPRGPMIDEDWKS